LGIPHAHRTITIKQTSNAVAQELDKMRIYLYKAISNNIRFRLSEGAKKNIWKKIDGGYIWVLDDYDYY
jgi:hypothetical protein